MRSETTTLHADLAIIGTGLSGMSAALFAVNRGLSTVLIGSGSPMNFASGLMDLMGVWPSSKEWEDPWTGIARVRKEIPGHPYATISDDSINQAFIELIAFLKVQGLDYRRSARRNVNIITSLGTIKKSYLVPATMWNGMLAFENQSPSLIVDFSGMKLFSACQIASTLSEQWPGLSSVRLEFPNTSHLEEVYPEHLARALDVQENRKRLADLLRPHLKTHAYVGFPAVLGTSAPGETVSELEALLERPVFEIPTPPVSVPGIRLHEALIRGFEKHERLHFVPDMAKKVTSLSGKGFSVTAGNDGRRCHVRSQGVLLCTGRFLGRGLIAERSGIREALLGLPVTQPESRQMWHHSTLFHPKGHPVNRAGILVDPLFRPLIQSSAPYAEQLHAAGSILAHSDWTRMKCGSGVAVATAHAAVTAFDQGM
ncbi:MAG: glycerol-3-phosphate dehydrogenase subunit GlpB [Desulfotignum sp.]|nr:glycerol-3-phosphate dehydrogenase subunit GlpB [Desulfotignum sp.]